MIQIDLTHSEMLKSFAEIEGQGLYIDLHNQFKCDSIILQGQKKELTLSFTIEDDFVKKIKQVDIIFVGVNIESFSLKDDKGNPDAWTIDNMYRGCFENNKGLLSEASDDGRYYYYVDFCQEYSFELFAKTVTANIFLND